MRHVMVTGGSGVIGGAVAELFATRGDAVTVVCHSRRDEAEVFASRLRGWGCVVSVAQCDLRDEVAVAGMFASVRGVSGPVNVLVGCAGNVVGGGDPLGLSVEQLRAEWDTNVVSFYLSVKYATQQMVESGVRGHVVGVTSIRGLPHCGRPPILGYSAAKAAMVSMVGTLAKELAPAVLVNGVAPGFVYTPNYDAMDEATKESFLSNTPVGGWVPAEDVAEACWMLAGSTSLTGQNIVVDGGFSLKLQ